MATEDFQGADGLKLGNLPKTCGSWIEVDFRVARISIREAGEKQASAQCFRERITRSSGRNVRQEEAIRRQSPQEFGHRFNTFAVAFALRVRAHPGNGLFQSIAIPRWHSGVM